MIIGGGKLEFDTPSKLHLPCYDNIFIPIMFYDATAHVNGVPNSSLTASISAPF